MKSIKLKTILAVLALGFTGLAQAQDAYCQAIDICPNPYYYYIDESVTNNITNVNTTNVVNKTEIKNTYVTQVNDDKAIASALAISASLATTKDSASGLTLGAGVGVFKNQQSLALSLIKVKDSFKANLSLIKPSSSSFGYSAGIGVSF